MHLRGGEGYKKTMLVHDLARPKKCPRHNSMSKDQQKDLDLDIDGPPADGLATLPTVPLDEVERPAQKGHWSQIVSVVIAGVALFSDGYNIQIAGECLSALQDGHSRVEPGPDAQGT